MESQLTQLNAKHWALICVLASIVLAALIGLGWDIYVLWILRDPLHTWCAAFRQLNRASNGLLAAMWICVFVGLTWHLLFLNLMPRDWKP